MVLVCGLLGIMAGQRRTNFVYIVSYLLVSVLSLAAMGLLLIFTATGLARDTGAPLGFFVDLEVSVVRMSLSAETRIRRSNHPDRIPSCSNSPVPAHKTTTARRNYRAPDRDDGRAPLHHCLLRCGVRYCPRLTNARDFQ